MPSNKDLIKAILELDADANTDGLNNPDLAKLLKKLREAKELEGVTTEPKPEVKPTVEPLPVVEPVATGPTVAKGKTITSKRGILSEGDPICADDLGGGAEALAALIAGGYVTE